MDKYFKILEKIFCFEQIIFYYPSPTYPGLFGTQTFATAQPTASVDFQSIWVKCPTGSVPRRDFIGLF